MNNKKRSNGFLKNKNTVTIIASILIVVVLIVGYNYRVNNAVSMVKVPYAKVEIPEKTEIIGSGCFCYCDSINKFRVNKNNSHFTAYEDALFTSDMKTLIQYPCGSDAESYSVPKGVEIIGRNAFTHALSLREITLPDTVTKLKPYAFSSCTNITEIELPSSLSFIADSAFKNASNLCRIYVHNDNVEIFPEAFIGDYSLVIYGNHSSNSEAYAQRYNIPFSVLEESDTNYPHPQKNCLLT